VSNLSRVPITFTSDSSPYPDNMQTNAQWAWDEFGAIKLGDLRSDRRMVKVFGQMLNSPGMSIPQCTGSLAEAKAFYRLLDNDLLTDTLILDVHRKGVIRRASASRCLVLLAIQDTTTCNFDTHKSLKELGTISSNQGKAEVAGLHVHSTLLTAADNDQVFGLLGAKLYARKAGLRKAEKAGTRNRQPITEKESCRWIESIELARKAQQDLHATWLTSLATQEAGESAEAHGSGPIVVSVGDREADIYELLIEAQLHRDEGLGLLVRSQYNRSLVGEEAMMWEQLAGSESQGSVHLKLPRSQGQKARSATLSVRFIKVQIAVPAHKAKYLKMTTPVDATIIELKEEGVEGGICWRLLTTLPVPDLEQAIRLARWYAKRWQIEEFHRVLKTGCRVESRQMRDIERLKPMIALDMIVACCIMGMSAAARERPESPASDWLDPDEIQAIETYERKGRPAEPNTPELTIGTAVRFIGRLGGHLGRKSDGHPGAQVIWQGLHKLDAITEAWRMFGPQNICG